MRAVCFEILRSVHSSLSYRSVDQALQPLLPRLSAAAGCPLRHALQVADWLAPPDARREVTAADLDRRDAVVRLLVEAAQVGTPASESALSILLVAYRGPLTSLAIRVSRSERTMADGDADAQVLATFIAVVRELCLGRVGRISATLILNTRRRVWDAVTRERQRESLCGRRAVDADLDTLAWDAAAWSDLRIAAAVRDLEATGVPDARLLALSALHDLDQHEVAALAGVSAGAARKRLERARRRLRASFAPPCHTGASCTA
jgi:RNA polymerase sigma-70 factor (ECF subfamily)